MPGQMWVEKSLSYSGSMCQFLGRKRPACAKCVDACPKQALKTGANIIEIDPELCNDCGDCVSICPSGALGLKIECREPIGERLQGPDGTVLVLCAKSAWQESIEPDLSGEKRLPAGVEPILIEGIGVLSETDFAAVLLASQKAVVVLALGERDKDRPFVRAAELVGEISNNLFSTPLVRVFTDTDTFWRKIEAVAQLPQRVIPQPSPEPEGEGKRAELRRILSAWLAEAGEISSATVIRHPSYGAISSDSDKCVLCAACANQCKVRSLRVVKEDYWLLYHTPIACLNCGACVALCPEEALSLQPGLRLDRSFLSRQEIGRSEAVRCTECGRPFSTAKRSRRVSQKVEAARGDDPIRRELAALCPECRTKKAFTTYSDWTASR